MEHNYVEFETRIDNPITQNPLQRSNSAASEEEGHTEKARDGCTRGPTTAT